MSYRSCHMDILVLALEHARSPRDGSMGHDRPSKPAKDHMTQPDKQVTPIDLNYRNRPHGAAAFLVRTNQSVVLVECGPSKCTPALEQGLMEHGIQPDDVDQVFLTHIHLDHGGGTGEWTRRGAHVYVHPRGAPHLVDPSHLMASATRIFGADLDTYLGRLDASPAESIHAVADGEKITIDNAVFQAVETPGHARHHIAWLLEIDGNRHVFTGDTAGMRLPGTDFVVLPLVPPELDVERWLASIERVRSLRADALWLTHFGLVEDQDAFLQQAAERIPLECAFITDLLSRNPDAPREELRATYRAWQLELARPYGVTAEQLDDTCDETHYEANLTGVARFLQKGPPS